MGKDRRIAGLLSEPLAVSQKKLLVRRSSSQRRVGGVVVDACGLHGLYGRYGQYGRYGRIALTKSMSFCESGPEEVGARKDGLRNF